MNQDEATPPPSSLRSSSPALRPTIRSDAMKRFHESTRRRIFMPGESTPIVVHPGNHLELYRFVKDHLLDPKQLLHVINPSKPSHEDTAPDIPDNNLLILSGAAVPLKTWEVIEDSLEKRLLPPRGVQFSPRMVMIVFAEQGQLAAFKSTQLMTSKTNWEKHLVWPQMKDRAHDRRGLMCEILEVLRGSVKGLERVNKNIHLDPQASAIIQGEHFETVLDLYQRIALGFRHAVNGGAATITKEHLFLPAEKSPPAPPQT